MGVKFFCSSSLEVLETSVNEFISEFDDELYSFEVEYSFCESGIFVMVIYRKRWLNDWKVRREK